MTGSSSAAVPAATGVQSLARGFELLETLADAGGEAGLSELAERTGLAPATIHRLVRTLVGLGYLRQLPSRRYTLGPRLVRLGDTAERLFGRWATPVLGDLVGEIGETANLAVLDGDHAVYVAQVPSPHSVRMFTEIGRRVPLHCTGVGKALLTTLPDADVTALLGRTGLPAVTDTTITDPVALRAEIALGRERGYVIDEGEQEPGVRCVAAPVPGPHGPAAVSVSGPQGRVDEAALARIAPLVVAAGLRLGAILADT
ncbi:IclR family transcriptional regulator [Pseudonocardia bannensis]|uniref:Glycerol operon regulatory protein n=1 Tax=Pseudonocardia bannensis TaxID=630973 RepID=A0A848DGG5_9PSEU|nr:IclR family transcriptional regulator [Pseudonocardia bannensis]NMH91760.1 IclR family transcriptional regulator [Pseudonocardia bannensis]